MATQIRTSTVTHNTSRGRSLYGMTAATWYAVIKDREPLRRVVGPALAKVYSGPDPSTDHETVIHLDLRRFHPAIQEGLVAALERDNIMVDAVEMDVMDEVEETEPAPKRTSRKRAKKNTGVVIPEGYGDQERGVWFPGYDAKWKSVLIKRVDKEANEEAAAEMVSRNWWTQDVASARLAKARNKATEAEEADEDEEDDTEVEFEEIEFDDEEAGETDVDE